MSFIQEPIIFPIEFPDDRRGPANIQYSDTTVIELIIIPENSRRFGTLGFTPVVPGSVVISRVTPRRALMQDKAGIFNSVFGSGIINYITGEFDITFSNYPELPKLTSVYIEYKYSMM